jgi:hypothetical protein
MPGQQLIQELVPVGADAEDPVLGELPVIPLAYTIQPLKGIEADNSAIRIISDFVSFNPASQTCRSSQPRIRCQAARGAKRASPAASL